MGRIRKLCNAFSVVGMCGKREGREGVAGKMAGMGAKMGGMEGRQAGGEGEMGALGIATRHATPLQKNR